MKKSELKEIIKSHVKGLMEVGKEVVITTNDGTSKTASSAEKLRAKQASDDDDIVTYKKRGVNEAKEFLRMQKLAGLITEGQFQKKMEENQESDIAKFLNDNFEEVKSKLGDPGSKFEIIGDEKVAPAGDGDDGIDISFDKEHMLKLFPEDDPYNNVESVEIGGKTVYYNDYR